ncbi:MAG: response regulator [Acidobacteria bacterium]|jgi:FixJ family two-component response regulator|nr:MAG: response regulator [Acidobacteriota bacterium]
MSSLTNTYIAVVDDDESFCRSLGRLLRAADYQPVTYPSAEAFLADTKHPRFDCLLLDISLGGISGLELRRRLGAVGSTTPVIFITAHDDPATRLAAHEAGCVAFINKVEHGDVLLKAIHSAVRSNPN